MSNDPDDFERDIRAFCDDVNEILRTTLPAQLVAAAKNWREGLASDDVLQHARRQFADEVDRFIRGLPEQPMGKQDRDVAVRDGSATVQGRGVGVQESSPAMQDKSAAMNDPVHVVALTMDRIESLRQLLTSQPPQRREGTLGEHLEDWAIGEWRARFSRQWEAAHGQRPWGPAQQV